PPTSPPSLHDALPIYHQLALLRQENTPAEQTEGVSTGRYDGAQLETPALLAHGACAPGRALSSAHARHVTGAVARQGRAVGDLRSEEHTSELQVTVRS